MYAIRSYYGAVPGVEQRHQPRDAVKEHLAADDADRRVVGRLSGEVFAAAEADFEPGLLDRSGEQRARVERLFAARHGDFRQQGFHQARTAGPQGFPLAAAVKVGLARFRRA